MNNYNPQNSQQNENPFSTPTQSGGPGTQGTYSAQYNYTGAPMPPDENGLFNENRMARKNGTSATIRLSDWMKADCLVFLNLIPCIGSLVAIALYFMLAFSAKTAASLKTRYQANLIWSGVFLVLYVILLIVMISVGATLGSMLESQS